VSDVDRRRAIQKCRHLANKSSPSNFGTARRSHTTTQQGLHWFQLDAPKFFPKTAPSPLTITTRTCSSTDPTCHPKRHPAPVSHFATIHFPDTPTDRQTDTQTDRQMDRRQLDSMSAYAHYIDRQRRANSSETKLSTDCPSA